jgi:hypothetical protein
MLLLSWRSHLKPGTVVSKRCPQEKTAVSRVAALFEATVLFLRQVYHLELGSAVFKAGGVIFKRGILSQGRQRHFRGNSVVFKRGRVLSQGRCCLKGGGIVFEATTPFSGQVHRLEVGTVVFEITMLSLRSALFPGEETSSLTQRWCS